MIPAETCEELSCGKGQVYGRTDGRTDGQTQAMTIPLQPERPRGNEIHLTKHLNSNVENI